MRIVALILALTETAGAAAAERALPLFLGVGIASTILFAGNGLSARDVVLLCDGSSAARAGLWLAWLTATVPLARDLYGAPSALFLRSMPVERAWFLAVTAVHMLALQAPWILLWGVGGGASRGAAAALLSIAAQSLLVARPRGAVELGAAALVGLAVAAPPWALGGVAGWLALPALPLSAFALRVAWQRAPERPPSPLRLVRGPALLSLSASYGARLLRAERALLMRGLLVAALGGGFAGVGARNNDALAPGALSSFSLMVTAIFLSIAAAGVAGPLADAQRRMGWILDTTATTPWVRALALRGALGAWGLVFGALSGAAAGAAAQAAPAASARAALAGATLGAALGALSGGALRWSERRGQLDGGRFAVAMTAVAAGALGCAAALGELAAAALALAALIDAAMASRSTIGAGALRSSSMVLEVRSLRKRFGGRVVLDGLDLSIEGPTTLAVRGDNGAGKSTLIKVVAGVIERDSGEVFIEGHPIDDRKNALSSVGYVPDAGELPGHLITRELLALYAALKGAPEPAAEQIEKLGAERLLDERLSALSLGQRRRVGLLSALIGDPSLLLLDEPTNGLDAGGLEVLIATLRDRATAGKSALIATHDRSFIDAIGAATVTLAHGRIA